MGRNADAGPKKTPEAGSTPFQNTAPRRRRAFRLTIEAPGAVLDAGTDAVSIALSSGAGLTNSTSGDLTLRGLTAGALTITNQGPTAGTIVNLLGVIAVGGPASIATNGLTIDTALAASTRGSIR